jgi:hypothetical protein
MGSDSLASDPVRRRGADRLILRGYGPLAALLVVLLLITIIVPSKPRTTADSTTQLSGVGNSPDVATGSAYEPAAPLRAGTITRSGRPATSAGKGSASSTAAAQRGTAAGPNIPQAAGAPALGYLPGGVTLGNNCSGGAKQDGNSAYSPPCLDFAGLDNGGATTRGVTKDTITVAYRDIGLPISKNSELEKTAEKKGLISSPEAQARTREALLQYFNSHFQLYGRKVRIVGYKGRGDSFSELNGSGQEAANADALKVGQEIKAFADLSAVSQPYLDALVRQKVVAFGGLHMPISYYKARAPYAWGQLIDCTTLLASAADLLAKRFPANSDAVRAGSAKLRTQPRKFGLVVPDDAIYAQCLNEARPKFAAAGISFKEIRYSLDFSTMQQEAPNIAAQLKNAGVTTVIMVTDPVLPFFLSGSATQQDYWPEWFLTGTVLTDADAAGQFYDQDQWQFAYGQSFISDIKQGMASESYRAYKSIRPNDEPTATRDLEYYSMLMLFIGLQLAGPDLTPTTFEQGMFHYPGANGPLGHWSWGPNDFTAVDDAREIYWDRKAISSFDNQPGRYVAPDGDRRYRSNWPTKAAPAPIPPPAAP